MTPTDNMIHMFFSLDFIASFFSNSFFSSIFKAWTSASALFILLKRPGIIWTDLAHMGGSIQAKFRHSLLGHLTYLLPGFRSVHEVCPLHLPPQTLQKLRLSMDVELQLLSIVLLFFNLVCCSSSSSSSFFNLRLRLLLFQPCLHFLLGSFTDEPFYQNLKIVQGFMGFVPLFKICPEFCNKFFQHFKLIMVQAFARTSN